MWAPPKSAPSPRPTTTDPSQGSPWAPCGGSESRSASLGFIGPTWLAFTARATTGRTPWSWTGATRTMGTRRIFSDTRVVMVEIFLATRGPRNSLVIRNSPTPTGSWNEPSYFLAGTYLPSPWFCSGPHVQQVIDSLGAW